MTTEKADPASSITDGLQTVSYEKNREGTVETVKSDGYQPVNEANLQAWEEIERQIEQARQQVTTGRRSCLYYYMISNQMSVLLLAQYSQLPAWRVMLHLYPYFFARLSTNNLQRYADIFQVPVEALTLGELRPPVYNSFRRP